MSAFGKNSRVRNSCRADRCTAAERRHVMLLWMTLPMPVGIGLVGYFGWRVLTWKGPYAPEEAA